MTLRSLPTIATFPSFETAASKESVAIEADKGRLSANRSTNPTVEVEAVDCGAAASVEVGWTGVRATPKPASLMAHSTVTRALALWAHT